MNLDYNRILEHYTNPKVQIEITEFCRNRWGGLHCETLNSKGRKILVRHLKRTRTPLRIEKPSDVARLFSVFRGLKPRTVYVTANVYRKLLGEEDIVDLPNIEACLPTWDVDNRLEDWKATAYAILEIVSKLESMGISRSVFVKFSGRGAHVHVHHSAISNDAKSKYNPLDLAYALVEYIRNKIQSRIVEAAVSFKAEKLRVDNEMDAQRLFVSPLSIHKEEAKVAVCIQPNRLESFDPEAEANLKVFKHYDGWNRFTEGEADELAIRAYSQIGGCPYIPKLRKRRKQPLDQQIAQWLNKR